MCHGAENVTFEGSPCKSLFFPKYLAWWFRAQGWKSRRSILKSPFHYSSLGHWVIESPLEASVSRSVEWDLLEDLDGVMHVMLYELGHTYEERSSTMTGSGLVN